jgi:hypothetical protein
MLNFATILKAVSSIGYLLIGVPTLVSQITAGGTDTKSLIIGIIATLGGLHSGASAVVTDPKKH